MLSFIYFFFFFPKNLVFSWNDFQVEGLQRPCSGSFNKTPPKEILWKTYSHRLFFGYESTHSWVLEGLLSLILKAKSRIKPTCACIESRMIFVFCFCLISFISPLYLLSKLQSFRKYFLCKHGTSKHVNTFPFHIVIFSNFSHRLEQFNDVFGADTRDHTRLFPTFH